MICRPSFKSNAKLTPFEKKKLCGFMLPLWATKLIFLSYTYSAASTKRWSSDIYTVHSWGSHTYTDTQCKHSLVHTRTHFTIVNTIPDIIHTNTVHDHTPEHVGVESNSNSRKQVYYNVAKELMSSIMIAKTNIKNGLRAETLYSILLKPLLVAKWLKRSPCSLILDKNLVSQTRCSHCESRSSSSSSYRL